MRSTFSSTTFTGDGGLGLIIEICSSCALLDSRTRKRPKSEESPGNEADLKTVEVGGVVAGLLSPLPNPIPIILVVIGEDGID